MPLANDFVRPIECDRDYLGSDVLGDGYQQLTIPLGPDPDGEGDVEATLVRYQPGDLTGNRAVLYVHGFTDYFFQQHVAEHFAEQGYSFFALDLRKCGRSRRPGQTPHFVTDLKFYDAELDEALRLVREQIGGGQVLLVAHSTGGLILPLWLDRLERRPGGSAGAGVAGLILNSPWFDLQGPALLRTAGTSAAIDALGRVSSKTPLPGQKLDTYGASLHVGSNGAWEYNLDWKPLTGFPVRFGWLRAIRRGHAQLHHGLDIGVPSLILAVETDRLRLALQPHRRCRRRGARRRTDRQVGGLSRRSHHDRADRRCPPRRLPVHREAPRRRVPRGRPVAGLARRTPSHCRPRNGSFCVNHFDLAIIGTGSGNSILDERYDGKKVAILEESTFGGTCLNVGCIPTKMFVYAAEVARTITASSKLGIDATLDDVRWSDIVKRVFGRIDPISAGGERYRTEDCDNVTVFRGTHASSDRAASTPGPVRSSPRTRS